jgi:hypothetical protein
MARWDKPERPTPAELTIQPLTPTTHGIGSPQTVQATFGQLPYSPLYGSAPGPYDAGVTGESNIGPGVHGVSRAGSAIAGSGASDGVFGESRDGKGVHGADYSGGVGVHGESAQGTGVHGDSTQGIGVFGESGQSYGVFGLSHSGTQPGVLGRNDGGGPAGLFDGPVLINGNLNIGSQGDVILNDCAEHFPVVDGAADPGTVMVIDQDGGLRPSSQPYDRKVAGVVSGAGNYRPGIVLGKQEARDNGLLIALLGKVYCKVDAQYSPIEVGDLLTTSATPGHAMKSQDQSRAFGCVIGKALRSVEAGRALIPILIALQ